MFVDHVKVDCHRIHNWDSLHDEFNRVFGFPGFYGRNMNAWIDCMTSLDEPKDGLTKIHVEPGKLLVLELANASDLKARAPDLYLAIVECSGFVNWRRMEKGARPVLTLSFYV